MVKTSKAIKVGKENCIKMCYNLYLTFSLSFSVLVHLFLPLSPRPSGSAVGPGDRRVSPG